MLGVGPKSEGLAVFYKLNRSESTGEGSIFDSAKNAENKTKGISIVYLNAPLKIQ